MIPVKAHPDVFMWALGEARRVSPLIADMTSPIVRDDTDTTTYYLTLDVNSGYGIREDGELVHLFSTIKGRGKELVHAAIWDGANHLNCFDGYLVRFYEGFGFTETRREPNWIAGGPDVVWMERA